MDCIFLFLIKSHLATVAFCIAILITLPLLVAVLLYDCSSAESVETARDVQVECWTQKYISMNFLCSINFSSCFKQSSKYNDVQREKFLQSKEQNKGFYYFTADK